RYEHKCNKHRGKSSAIPTVEPPPEMQTNHKMSPHQQYERDLSKPCPGIDPEIGDLIGVIDVDVGQDAGAARVYDVDEQQIRNCETKQNLDSFPQGHVIVASPKQYQQRDHRVSDQATI